MTVAAYADVRQAHNAGIAAVAVDTVGEGLRHTDTLNPPLRCPMRVVCRYVIAVVDDDGHLGQQGETFGTDRLQK